MKVNEVLALYDRQVRADPPPHEGLTSEWVGGVLRTTGVYNLIECSRLGEGEVDAAIEAEMAHFRRAGAPVEWKVFGHDRPPLGERLAAKGFEPQDEEVFLAYDLSQPLPPASCEPPTGLTVKPIVSEAELADFVAVVIAVFGKEIPEQTEAVRRNLGRDTMAIHLAYLDGRPVGSGRLDTPSGKDFAGLYTGGVIPALRGQGVYRALVEARMHAAKARGYSYAIVEAGPMSLPILRRLGFMALTTTRAYEFNP